MPEDPRTPAPSRPDWTREQWLHLADRMLSAARRHGSPGHARITFPGAEGGYGHDVDGLEGFARTFLTAGFRIAGARGEGVDELLDWYATGLATGSDPHSPERWVRLTEHSQAKVEAASIALILDLTRPWLWDRLDPAVQERIVDYLAPAVGDDTYPRINWVWFRIVVQTFLRSAGGPWSAGDIAADLAAHESFRRADGWLSDGDRRGFDHYIGWALHLYPILWMRMLGASGLTGGREKQWVSDLDRYLQDAVALVGADGSPLVQGRSLIYRFAAAVPFWAGVVAEVPSVPAGQLRHAADLVVRHFVDRGAPDGDGLLTMGWHGTWRRLAQSYSGPGSPYWASKGLLGIALPADHPVWTAPSVPLPVERGDFVRTVAAPAWIVSGTRADGIVRVVNHGTDHGFEGRGGADSPLYARLGYSTATAPVLDEAGWTRPEDQSVVLVDRDGNTTHRSGMRALGVPETGSDGLIHWVRIEDSGPDHGSGRAGTVRTAARLTVFSLVRGIFEVRLAQVDDVRDDPATLRLRIGGWPVTGDLISHLSAILPPGGATGTTVHDDAGPFGGPVRVPWVDHPVEPGAWTATLVALTTALPEEPRCRVEIGDTVRVTWPDGVITEHHLDLMKEQG
ncbi:hypothetical protein GCM10010168_56840 [Actinoplanes ianthinogenes]|uniref:DUF2264 domain-containing protein n=1 Tax=Actinoplanes ianthinogenes TaxID=122358 RepID=A0ABM7M2R7_9ACTN|nr:DUF2264 domain-containing protein [Actinoplanes ianthinogenes]BCJ45896.1 hypothetical protein Aiant_65530 [Actinoplanes ianthinogenes]GGR31290.1 hypothetical protein GCM10010168_56840 [Actinoplanes ianthinogenes]